MGQHILHCDICNEETDLRDMQMMGDSLVCEWCHESPSINSNAGIRISNSPWDDENVYQKFYSPTATDPELATFLALLEALGSTVDKAHQRELIVAYNSQTVPV